MQEIGYVPFLYTNAQTPIIVALHEEWPMWPNNEPICWLKLFMRYTIMHLVGTCEQQFRISLAFALCMLCV
jgi:hypothetical protein